jgi:two-component sensor histidine kinase
VPISADASGGSDVLAAELRHRITNSFQLINSLIAVRLRGLEDGPARRHLTWLSDAVMVLGLLQQHLIASHTSTFADWLKEAVAFWDRMGGDLGIKVTIDSEGTVAVPQASVVTLAIVTHELITNCVTHAFPDGRGQITVRLQAVSDGEALLVVSDDGCGLTLPVASTQPGGRGASIGLGLVRQLAERLGGSFVIGPNHPSGTSARVTFPL